MEADNLIVERAKQGDINAFSELVIRHQKSLLRVAFRITGDFEMAQDVVQESLLKAYQKLNTFEGRSAFKSWVYQITMNTAKNKLRGKRPDMVDIENAQISDDHDFEQAILNEDLKLIVKNEVERLPLKQRTALSLRIFEDLSFSEIAEIMSCPYDTAKANYRHALIKLRHSLSEQDDLKPFLSDKTNQQLEVDA